ncbi:MAG: hypothetical protein QE284_02160 [Rhizobium sp.]|nr:hypothetical protein [Rhizobium sp.]
MFKFSKINKLAASVTVGVGLSTLSAIASAYSAYQAAEQVRYAKEALSAAEKNQSFSHFYTSWGRLCKALDPTDRIVLGADADPNAKILTVTATDFGYSFAPFDYDEYRSKVVSAIREAGEKYDMLSLWLPDDEILNINFVQTMNNLTILSMVDSSQDDAILYDSIFREVGYCNFWRVQYPRWFQNRQAKLPFIPASDVKLQFKTQSGENLTACYIKKRRTVATYGPPPC